MLDTRFPRIPGDIGNPASFPFATRKRIVAGATVDRALGGPDEALLGPFLAAARALESEGAAVITSSCGFLTPFQASIAAAVGVPVVLSSLMQVPLIHSFTRGRVGIISADSRSLTERILYCGGITADVPVALAGLQGSQAFRDAILSDGDALDQDRIEQDVVAGARGLLADHPDISAFVLECHNLPPYRRAVRMATGKPVFDIVSFVCWVWESTESSGFAHP